MVCGVPQGSILGQLLFILYVNDMTYTSDVLDFILFAADPTITYSHKYINDKIDLVNKELKDVSREISENTIIHNLIEANKLSVNASKINYMTLGTPQMLATKKFVDIIVILNAKCSDVMM